MKRNIAALLIIFLASMGAAPATTQACTWAAYVNGKAAFVMRTVDWHHSDNLVVSEVTGQKHDTQSR